MGRIPKEKVERLNRETALERVLSSYGVELTETEADSSAAARSTKATQARG